MASTPSFSGCGHLQRGDVHERAAVRQRYLATHPPASTTTPADGLTARPASARPMSTASRFRRSLTAKVVPHDIVHVGDVQPLPEGLTSWAAAPETAELESLVLAKSHDNAFVQVRPRRRRRRALLLQCCWWCLWVTERRFRCARACQAEMYHPSPLDISRVALPEWLADLAVVVATQVCLCARVCLCGDVRHSVCILFVRDACVCVCVCSALQVDCAWCTACACVFVRVCVHARHTFSAFVTRVWRYMPLCA